MGMGTYGRPIATTGTFGTDQTRLSMLDVEPKGAVHWIDHYVVGTNDMGAWADWAVNATGITRRPLIGLTTAARKSNIKITCFLWWDGGSCRIGAFLQPEIYPPAKALGEDLPRCGFYIRPEDIDFICAGSIDTRFRIPTRLAQPPMATKAPSSISPIRTATNMSFGRRCICRKAPWRSARLKKSAASVTPFYGARDLGRTADFFEKYCGIAPEQNSKTAEGTLVLRLRAGGRIVYKLVDQVDERVSGHGTWWDMHTALTVRQEEFLPNYRRMWEGIPEEKGYKADLNLSLEEQEALPARTGLHRSPVGIRWKEICDRGDEFYDWDCHSFHFIGGKPLERRLHGVIRGHRTGRIFARARPVDEKAAAARFDGRSGERKSFQRLAMISDICPASRRNWNQLERFERLERSSEQRAIDVTHRSRQSLLQQPGK